MLGGFRSLWQMLFSFITRKIYLHVVESFKELKDKNFSDLRGHRAFLFPQVFDHEVKGSGEVVHDYVEVVILNYKQTYLIVDFNVIIDHEDDVLMIDTRNYTEFSVFVLGVLEDLLDCIELVILFIFGLIY